MTRRSVRYHLALWVANVAIFCVLDFAKRIDDLLYGLSFGQLAVNVGLVAVCSWPLCLLLGLTGAAVERAAGLRTAHAAAAFGFLTVQLWSLRAGAGGLLQQYPPATRLAIAVAAFTIVALVSAAIGYRIPQPWAAFESRSRKVLLGWAALAALLLAAPLDRAKPSPSPSDKPNVVLITVDALSAKHTSVYGYAKETTPNLAALAGQSVVFDRFHSNFNVTGLALPSFNGYLSNEAQGRTLANSLEQAGYPHRAFFSFWAPELFFLEGFNDFALSRRAMLRPTYRALSRVFSEPQMRWFAGLGSEEFQYYNPYSSNYLDDMFWRTLHYPPQASLDEALAYLRAHPSGAFVWVHLWQPHFPYTPDADVVGKFGPGPDVMRPWVNVAYDESEDGYVASLANLYDAAVFSVDRQIGRFLGSLKQDGLFDKTLFIVSADHGESFERGYQGHSGWPLMEPITHVPLIVHRPGDSKEIRVATMAHQLDVAPTVLDLLGQPVPSTMKGESLVPYISEPSKLSDRYKISISLLASTGAGGQLAVYWRTFKLMFLSNDHSTYRLYDLFKDPEAVTDISKQHPDLVKEMMKHLAGGSAGP